MQKIQKLPVGTAVFYKSVEAVKEVRAGYLYKSPPPKVLSTEKSWKRRFFVLFKVNEQDHQLKYFKSAEERDKAIGEIDLTRISLLSISPQHHPKWGWVSKNVKCSPSCVLYVKAGEREYFLVGEDSQEVDDWFLDLFDALKKHPHGIPSDEARDVRIRSRSDPANMRSKSEMEKRAGAHNEPRYDDDDYNTYMTMGKVVELVGRACPEPLTGCRSENGADSPVEELKPQTLPKPRKRSSLSPEDMTPEEKDIEVNRADLKKHLTLTRVDGKPCVLGWTGQPQMICLFHKGDQILAINDLHTSNVEEFHMYLSKLLKNKVKLTILRQPGSQPLHSPSCLCSDLPGV
ncbi:pleckstrin homology domain-containing family S member 1-like [Lampris incognitus]|uniref:pleckstrin homology domain-containing family S member 1-like n=1 Tax=Lampris incognitus TaxID=2546036 RepID=UPI0024B6231F|nr:pleckstrin homology domain-containing family S member 1-like [Lampris incognitus]